MTTITQPASITAIQNVDHQPFVSEHDLRTTFALAMSAMYKSEVPLYGDLVRIVQEVNQKCRKDVPSEERLDLERHGAIRLGTPYELRTIRRVFALIGLYPVDYYDLSVTGLPMHATAFRPVSTEALSKNPFRVFTTLLRPELLRPEPRELALSMLIRRNIFSDELLKLIGVGEDQGGFDVHQAERFIAEALKTFKWQSIAAATLTDYQRLEAEHPILADITCFNSAHINHLTPRTLDIEMAEAKMRADGLAIKSRIEGPPARQWPILLRQTSFLALQEQTNFRVRGSKALAKGSHKARFGEIEQRGAAVTEKGRQLYDKLLTEAFQRMAAARENLEDIFKATFSQFPDDWNTLVRQGLVYFICRPTAKATDWSSSSPVARLSELLEEEVVETLAITYEDFLPFSAAGIFQSNLQAGREKSLAYEPFGDQEGMEAALGCRIANSQAIYSEMQLQSLSMCAKSLCIQKIVVDSSV